MHFSFEFDTYDVADSVSYDRCHSQSKLHATYLTNLGMARFVSAVSSPLAQAQKNKNCEQRSDTNVGFVTMMTALLRPTSRARLLPLLLLVAAAAAYAASAAEGTPASAAKTLRRTRGASAAGHHGGEAQREVQRDDMLAGVLDKLERLESKFRSMEEGGNEDHSPHKERRALQAAPRTVSLTQFNQFKRSVTTQLTTLNQSLASTGALFEALQKTVEDKVGGIEAELQKVRDSLLLLTDSTEAVELKATELEASTASLAEDIAGAAVLLDTTTQDLAALTSRLACVDAASDGNELVFSGCNVNIRNGLNRTETTNGRGNLVVGYNEVGTGLVNRDGSHMVIVGPRHNWRGFGGIVSGRNHRQDSAYASIVGGTTKATRTRMNPTRLDRV